MKCPKCNFTQINSYDLCLNCTFDLRAVKTSMGYDVTHPNLKYTDLCKIIFKDQINDALKASGVKIKPPEEKTVSAATSPISLPSVVPSPIQHELHSHKILPSIEPLTPPKLVACEKLYQSAFSESANKANTSFSIELFDIVGDSQKEKIKLLFETAEEEILNPQKSVRFKDALTKRKVKIENKELTAQLKKVVEAFENPALLLKNIKAKDLSHGKKPFVLDNVTPVRRGICFLLDLIFSSFLALLVAIIARIPFDIEFNTRLFGFSTNIYDFRFYVYGTILSLPLAIIIYSLFTYTLVGTTFGEVLIKSQAVKKDGQLPDFSDLLIKSFCLPFNFILAGLVFVLFKKYSFSDFFSDTFLHQVKEREFEVEPEIV